MTSGFHKKIFFGLIFICVWITFSFRLTDCKTNQIARSKIVSTSLRDTIVIKKNKKEYFADSKIFEVIDTTSDATIFKSFLKGIIEKSAPLKIQYFNPGPYKAPPEEFLTYDSIVYSISNEGRKFSDRIISESPDLRNDLSFLFKYFKRIHVRFSPYIENLNSPPQPKPLFESNLFLFDTTDITNDPMVIVNYKINLKKKNQRFILLKITAGNLAWVSAPHLVTFSRSGEFIDCIHLPEPYQGINGEAKIDQYGNIIAKYIEGPYQFENGKGQTIDEYWTMNYKLSVDENGRFNLENKKITIKNEILND